MESANVAPGEVPPNGLAGLRHIRHDIISGIVVSLVSLPLSSGIAIASGAPPIYGLISAIIAGLIFPFVGGAYLTISGPAAGLAPALLAIMVSFGGAGDADTIGAGYHFLLVVIFLVGCIQMLLALARLARFAAIIPVSVVEGMLASIGLMIIVKQLPMLFGFTDKVHAHEFYQYVLEVPRYASGMTPAVCAVSVATLALLFVLGSLKHIKALAVVPPQLIAVVVGVILGQIFGLGRMDGGFLISLPKEAFHGARLPEFGALLARTDLWYAAAIGVCTLTMIDAVESLATAMAIDRLDPWHRRSRPNRLLFAMGLSNVASSLFGGLTIIPGGVKSKVNIASGGRTLWANFTNAICLILYLVVARDLINMIPKGVLAAVLIHTGYKMCEPLVWKHMAHIGREQLGIFTFTIVVTLLTDLLWGIVAGVAAKFALNMVIYRYAVAAQSSTGRLPSLAESTKAFFATPVVRSGMVGDEYEIVVDRPVVCFNSMKLDSALGQVPVGAKRVRILLGEGVGVIDHTACENLMHTVAESARGEVPIRVVGLGEMLRLSEYANGTHIAAAALLPA